jgi:hypothetical protein
MDAVDFLDDDIVNLPKTRNGDFVAFMDDIYNKYIAHVAAIDRRTALEKVILTRLPRIVDTCKLLMSSLRHAVAGSHDNAYTDLDLALAGLGPHFDLLCSKSDMSTFVNPMYRFRTRGPDPWQRHQIFHIPFESLQYVKEQRYSFAHLPCLYLGGSTHVCWRELGEPQLDTVQVSHYSAVPRTNLRVLNFGHRLPLLAAWVDEQPQYFRGFTRETAIIAAHVACWPLIAMCSIRVPDRAKPERPEYLIPQLVLEWITKTREYHGIRYFSTHYDEYPDDPKTYMNYVFPSRTTPPQGLCSILTGLFELTEPKTWTDAKALPQTGKSRPVYKTRKIIDQALEADFGRAEDGILGLPLAPP